MHFISSNLLYDFSNDKYIENQQVECSRLRWVSDCLRGLKRKKTGSKVTGMNWPRTLRFLSQFFFSRTLEFQLLVVVRTYFHQMWMNVYIVYFGVITCLVTSLIFVEVRRFRLKFYKTAIEVGMFNLIFYNCHWKLSIQQEVIVMN